MAVPSLLPKYFQTGVLAKKPIGVRGGFKRGALNTVFTGGMAVMPDRAEKLASCCRRLAAGCVCASAIGMARGRRLKATFSDGTVDYLTTEKGFTHAWRVTGLRRGRPDVIHGWARSEALGQQAAASHTRSAAKHWKDVKAEIVEVGAVPKPSEALSEHHRHRCALSLSSEPSLVAAHRAHRPP
jgi:hypothetical protein